MEIKMIWYDDKKNVVIIFDTLPQIGIRYILPSDCEIMKQSKKKYPFINKKDLKVTLYNCKKNKTYKFVIHKGYCYDGATIPRFFWRIIGSNTDNKFLVAALIHDVLCENHQYIDSDREFSTVVFDALLKTSDVPAFQRFLMKHSVNFFQRFCRW